VSSAVCEDLLCPPVHLPEELEELRWLVRRFVNDHLIPYEEHRTLPPRQRERMRAAAMAMGLTGVDVPEEFGGAGLGALGYAVVSEELGRSTLYEDVHWLGYVGSGLVRHANAEQVDRYVRPTVRGDRFGAFAFTEATGGSDPARNLRTTARRQGQDWVINGRKVFISNTDFSDYFIVIALTDPAKRQHGGMTAFLVDREAPGFQVVRSIETLGDDHDPAEIDFQDVVVADAQRLGEVGEGFIVAQHSVNNARRWIGAHAVGRCTRLLELIKDYLPTREANGVTVPELGQAQAAVASIVLDMETTRWLTYRTAAVSDNGGDTRVLDSMVKVQGSEALCRATDTALQLFGGWGLTKELPVERMYREARRWRIVDGPNEVHRMVISRELFKRQQVADLFR
jgi:acyl-CoA dehydrogenase